ncbi:MAG: hypothetical protein VXX96_02765 [Bacteroidota bacterium]|jgi:hypothetical protein|nr:hypothetical protein [Bacteroidota bacterium]MEC7877143.1 hypothetical protein [Bacteroidota bacterium]MEC8367279.1 hypothetical protein [Bacteroidota bacterium]MEC8602102.1 hypothetical protein [Bacteroidota bacterium]
MPRRVFDFTKKVLIKVSFSTSLFKKELKKAADVLLPHEYQELRLWVENYVTKHPHLACAL